MSTTINQMRNCHSNFYNPSIPGSPDLSRPGDDYLSSLSMNVAKYGLYTISMIAQLYLLNSFTGLAKAFPNAFKLGLAASSASMPSNNSCEVDAQQSGGEVNVVYCSPLTRALAKCESYPALNTKGRLLLAANLVMDIALPMLILKGLTLALPGTVVAPLVGYFAGSVLLELGYGLYERVTFKPIFLIRNILLQGQNITPPPTSP
jgi:hypothetical protein